jgi:hypothetical protein
MTLPEFFSACDGYIERKGGKKDKPMTLSDLDEVMAGVDNQGNLIRETTDEA